MASPFLYFADDRLSPAELSAACLDGHLVGLGDAYLPADAVETASLRAESLRGLLGDTLAATHLSAAWIHGALGEPPARHTVQRAVTRRVHPPLAPRLVYRDLAIDEADLVRLGGVRVTSPVRTLADLARVADPAHEHAAALLAAENDGLALRAVTWLDDHPSLPHKRRARQRLIELAGRARSG
ncbi:hypothetical protein GCM10009775_00530 [Microbacterium aoyamense]|uniref:AbiEi antitoxin C-terminal domain-containing protein n=1 Tax=Microbacterium aoyamense TaxID=344166 RepID=A0ABP5AEH4_9MICO|nr:type IV toxin-antitoxin system AbiEi family antitoxin [Microbacterium aoyamense]